MMMAFLLPVVSPSTTIACRLRWIELGCNHYPSRHSGKHRPVRLPSLLTRSHAVEIEQPTFIVGCGRSGTTILGELLSQHPDVTYLNEPRHIWGIDPQTDIWTQGARGKLLLTAADAHSRKARAIHKAFVDAVGDGRLVEKLPINSFRVGYLNRLFPDARYVHLIRDGVEVAQSIGGEAQKYAWFGAGDYKWRLLVAYATAHGLNDIAVLAGDDPVLRGLVEWRLSVTIARETLIGIPSLEVRYETLLDQPEQTYTAIADFLNLPSANAPLQFARDQIRRQTARTRTLTSAMQQIAGELLADLGYGDS